MQCIGYSASDYEGKRYVKLHLVKNFQEGRGNGLESMKLQGNTTVEDKLKTERLPVNIRISDQEINMRQDKNGREVPVITILDIEIVRAAPRAAA